MGERFFKFAIFSNFPELIHGISNRRFGNMKMGDQADAGVLQNREQFLSELNINIADLVVPKQVHSANIVIVNENGRGKGSLDPQTAIAATDGVMTKTKNIYLMVTVADCLPILIYDPVLKIAGVFHAGWRGIIVQIVPKVIKKFTDLGSDPQNLLVGIGPGICQKHFVVKKDVLSFFRDDYPSAVMVRNNDGYVDLKKAVLGDLKKAGILSRNIEMTHICTVCENGVYGSYRKEGSHASHMAAVIGMRS